MTVTVPASTPLPLACREAAADAVACAGALSTTPESAATDTADVEERLCPPAAGWPVRVTTRAAHGRGVVTTRPVAADEILEVAALMVVPRRADLAGFDHVFDVDGASGIAGGVVSFANHAYTPNAAYDIDADAGIVTLYALVDLAAGVEVTVNYNGDPHCTDPVWFHRD